MIVPTIGRVVWYFPSDDDLSKLGMNKHGEQPFDAHVIYVWSETCVNLVVFDHEGYMFAKTSVPINLEGQSPHAEWMPYQREQAAKHAAEAAPAAAAS
jgi:hypothetical protein